MGEVKRRKTTKVNWNHGRCLLDEEMHEGKQVLRQFDLCIWGENERVLNSTRRRIEYLLCIASGWTGTGSGSGGYHQARPTQQKRLLVFHLYCPGCSPGLQQKRAWTKIN